MHQKKPIYSTGQTVESSSKQKIEKKWSFSKYNKLDTNKWTHGYHRYPAKFIPQLVEKLLDEYVKEDYAFVNDPFMGSGTTIVSAVARGYHASGTDINKISYLITKVKSTPIEPTYLDAKLFDFFQKVDALKLPSNFIQEIVEPLIPERHIERIDYWFSEENKTKIGMLLRIIYVERDEDIRDFLLSALSHILKNCSFWLQGSVKPTRHLKRTPSDPYIEIVKHLKKMQKGNYYFYKIVPDETKQEIRDYLNIHISDAKNQKVPDGSIDLIVTSSPYVTSYEYADLHQLSTIWLDLADDLLEYKKAFIGSHSKRYESKEIRSKKAQKIVNNMSLVSKGYAKKVEAFFVDMQDVINESFRVLKHGGKACYVVGNTEIKGVKIRNKDVFSEIFINAGFKIERVIERKVSNKMLPSIRNPVSGRFAKSTSNNNKLIYPKEYIIIAGK